MPEDSELDLDVLFDVMASNTTVGLPRDFVSILAKVATRMLLALGIHEAAKLMRPAPEGCKYIVQIVRKLEDDDV